MLEQSFKEILACGHGVNASTLVFTGLSLEISNCGCLTLILVKELYNILLLNSFHIFPSENWWICDKFSKKQWQWVQAPTLSKNASDIYFDESYTLLLLK